MRLRSATLLAAVFLLALHAPAQDSRANDPLHAYLRGCERFGFSGSVLVAKGGKILLAEGFGLADRAKNVPNAKDTLFEIASATKSFTAVAILQLEADGKLSCDDPIGKHLPGVPAGFEAVTIRHLLTHTSGMPRSATGGSGDDLESAVQGYLSARPVRKPGAGYEYWNGGFALLAGIVERASGGSYMDFVRRRIFEPAGMKSSGFTGDGGLEAAKIAVGYEGGEQKPRRADEHPYNGSYGWHYRGMGGLVTSVEDLWRFDRALRNDAVLPAKARAKLSTPCLETYACGFSVLDKPRLKIGHEGDVRGFHAQFFRYPADDGCIVVLANTGRIPMWTVEHNLQQIVFGDPCNYPKPPATAGWPTEKLDAVAGTYEASPGERLVVRAESGGFLLGAEGSEIARFLSTSVFGPPKPADPALVEDAQAIVRKVSEGDVDMLRQRINRGIPATWPDDVKAKYWPERVAGLGSLKSVRPAGASLEGSSTTVLLRLDFEKGAVHLKTVFVGDRLQIFDLHGPDFLAAARALPSPDGRLVRFAWEGKQPSPITIVRDASGRPTALKLEGAGTATTYKRLTAK